MWDPFRVFVIQLSLTSWRTKTDKTEEVRRLGVGRLLGDLSSKMAAKASGVSWNAKSSSPEAEPPRILIHSTHDTALAALLATLDVFDDKWVIVYWIQAVYRCWLNRLDGHLSPLPSRSNSSRKCHRQEFSLLICRPFSAHFHLSRNKRCLLSTVSSHSLPFSLMERAA